MKFLLSFFLSLLLLAGWLAAILFLCLPLCISLCLILSVCLFVSLSVCLSLSFSHIVMTFFFLSFPLSFLPSILLSFSPSFPLSPTFCLNLFCFQVNSLTEMRPGFQKFCLTTSLHGWAHLQREPGADSIKPFTFFVTDEETEEAVAFVPFRDWSRTC